MPKPIFLNRTPIPHSATNRQTSTVGEPSLINDGTEIFYTGNWYACNSKDNGVTWNHINPYTFLLPSDTKFACDQSVIHDHKRGLTFWILQYEEDDTGENTIRIAVKKRGDQNNNNWYWWDIQPKFEDHWRNQWFDYNHVALSDSYLYIGTNMFTLDEWKRCVVFKLSLEELFNETNELNYSYFETTTNGSLRCTLGSKDIMYFASIEKTNSIKVFVWPEKTDEIEEHIILVSRFNSSDIPYSAICPDGNNWLGRCDNRITGAWVSNNILGFMWTVNQRGEKPFPFVQVARIDATTLRLIDEPHIWNENHAFAYPDACPNESGDIGITLFRGGGNKFPDHIVGVWDTDSKGWKLSVSKKSTHSPSDEAWGDYISCRVHPSDVKAWIASGFTLQGGTTKNHIEPLYVEFLCK